MSSYSNFISSSLICLPASVNFAPYFKRKLHFSKLGELTVWDPLVSLCSSSSKEVVKTWGGGKMNISAEKCCLFSRHGNSKTSEVSSSMFEDSSLTSVESSINPAAGWPISKSWDRSSTFGERFFTSGEGLLISVNGKWTLAIFMDISATRSSIPDTWE